MLVVPDSCSGLRAGYLGEDVAVRDWRTEPVSDRAIWIVTALAAVFVLLLIFGVTRPCGIN